MATRVQFKLSAKEIHALYYKEGKTVRDLASLCACSYGTMHRHLTLTLQMKLRSPGGPRGPRA